MNPRVTGLLALVALALGAFVILFEIGGDPAREAASDDAKRIFPGLESSDVVAVEFETQDGIDARFERSEGRWRLVSPLSAAADGTAIDALAHALTNLPREGRVEAPRASSQYGLDDAARSIEFELEGDAEGRVRTLRIGRSTPVGGHVYVSGSASDTESMPREVAFVESYRLNAFNRNLDDLRERRIFAFEPGQVTRLRVSWPSHREGDSGSERVVVDLARDAAGAWQISAPITAQADPETVRELLSNLSYLRAEGFIDDPAARTKPDVRAALDANEIEIDWTLAGETESRRARIGGLVEGGRVVEGGSRTIGGVLHRIAAERLEDFPRSLMAYRWKQLSSFEVAAARQLEFEFASDTEVVTRAPEEASDAAAPKFAAKAGSVTRVVATLGEVGWSSESRRLDPDRVSELVRTLAGLRAAEIVADEMGRTERASLGLAPPHASIRVEDSEANPLAQISFGRLDAERGLFAQRSGDPAVYRIDPDLAEALPISRAAFESRFEAVADSDSESLSEPEPEPADDSDLLIDELLEVPESP